MRMLRNSGNPRAANLAALLKAVEKSAGMHIAVHAEPAGELEHA
ncbi:hypothetical protein [Paracraurococcus lichenis]|uniref:Uncharacterized protein n=1 Tax=Paracraurococcus lichenis TaxID=3064888 RepID=A0ABT9E8E7_9PROT|nr:hypothetical protein [Paracraurococcus sp. LOR1-02]MDO9712238.1 hypothetical protein [Paracraurococcus sp. LOR1-02]